MNALNVPNKFPEYHFIDIEQSKIDRLRELTAERPEKKSIHFYVGDANQVLRKKIIPKFPYSSFKRALCILDPYGVDIEWATIASLAPIKTMDIFLNFPLMDINRNAALKKLETADPQQGARLTKIWGDESWKELAYVEQGQLFNAPVLIKKIRGNEILKQGFRERLKQKAGFSCVPEPILMSNTVGGSLYFLFFASQKQVAQNIAQHIFENYRELA
jgi:three-Cys-motif partner protein